MNSLDEYTSNGLSVDRPLFYPNYKIAQFLRKDLSEATKQDIRNPVRRIEQDQNYTAWRKDNFKVLIKKFCPWLSGARLGSELEVEAVPPIDLSSINA